MRGKFISERQLQVNLQKASLRADSPNWGYGLSFFCKIEVGLTRQRPRGRMKITRKRYSYLIVTENSHIKMEVKYFFIIRHTRTEKKRDKRREEGL